MATKQGHPLWLLLVVLAQAIRQEKEMKGIQIGKEIQLYLFSDGKVFVGNPRNPLKAITSNK